MKKATPAPIPKGFKLSVVSAGIKYKDRNDMALVACSDEAVISAFYTTNRVKGAPVIVSQKRSKNGKCTAVVINAGNANVCTGEKGVRDAEEMAALVARGLRVDQRTVLVSSTGVIGEALPMSRIKRGILGLIGTLGDASIEDAAQAIMTTDRFMKVVTKRVKISSKMVTITGFAKGAGMIEPNMATMLAYILTDADITRKALDKAFKQAVERSFNSLSVDGDMSTSDTAMCLSSCEAENDTLKEDSKDLQVFTEALSEISMKLADMMARDGEGATKRVKITVKGAKSGADARRAAYKIANSTLVKTALYGRDANWGRVMAALGASGAYVVQDKVDIFFGKIQVAKDGTGTGRDSTAARALSGEESKLVIDLKCGLSAFEVTTCDMSEEYVKINADYRT